MKLLYANHQTCANQLLVSTLVSFIPIQCVNQCLLDCIRDGNTVLTPRDSQLTKKSRYFENIVLPYFQQSRPGCKIESNVTIGRQKKNDCFSVDEICYPCNTVFEAMGCYYHYCPCQEARPSLTDTDIERGIKKRQQDEMRRDYIQQKGYQIVEMWECMWWSLYKTDASVKSQLRENFHSNDL